MTGAPADRQGVGGGKSAAMKERDRRVFTHGKSDTSQTRCTRQL
jgi:hypothetical protein